MFFNSLYFIKKIIKNQDNKNIRNLHEDYLGRAEVEFSLKNYQTLVTTPTREKKKKNRRPPVKRVNIWFYMHAGVKYLHESGKIDDNVLLN